MESRESGAGSVAIIFLAHEGTASGPRTDL
jgi:hypothetical protein